jgi:hypothetical protein
MLIFGISILNSGNLQLENSLHVPIYDPGNGIQIAVILLELQSVGGIVLRCETTLGQ